MLALGGIADYLDGERVAEGNAQAFSFLDSTTGSRILSRPESRRPFQKKVSAE